MSVAEPAAKASSTDNFRPPLSERPAPSIEVSSDMSILTRCPRSASPRRIVPPQTVAVHLALWIAIRRNDCQGIELALRQGAKVNANISAEGVPALSYAARPPSTNDALKQILSHYRYFNLQQAKEMSVLQTAAGHRNVADVAMLLDARTRISKKPYQTSLVNQFATFRAESLQKAQDIVYLFGATHLYYLGAI